MSDSEESNINHAVFRDCLSTTLVRAESVGLPERKRRRRAKGSNNSSETAVVPVVSRDFRQDAEELSEFIDYLATEIFENLPDELRDLDFRTWRESEALQAEYSFPLTASSLSHLNLPPSISETLQTYNLISPDPTLDSPLPATVEVFLIPILTAYITSRIAPPPASTASRTDACEICERPWIPLSYHHLIPRFVHDKVVKRGWHSKEDLQNVAWLCGACHRFVHHFKKHEELARYYYTVDLLLEEEEVQKWAAWVGKLRWKGGKTVRRAR